MPVNQMQAEICITETNPFPPNQFDGFLFSDLQHMEHLECTHNQYVYFKEAIRYEMERRHGILTDPETRAELEKYIAGQISAEIKVQKIIVSIKPVSSLQYGIEIVATYQTIDEYNRYRKSRYDLLHAKAREHAIGFYNLRHDSKTATRWECGYDFFEIAAQHAPEGPMHEQWIKGFKMAWLARDTQDDNPPLRAWET